MSTLAKQTRIVLLFAALAQLIAFARTAVVAALFGASSTVDAYNLALVVPTLVAGIVSGWSQVSFVGRYLELLSEEEGRLAREFRSAIAAVLIGLSAAVGVLMFAGHDLVTTALVPASAQATRNQTTIALQIAACTLMPITLGEFFALVLNCHGRFVFASAAPILNAVVSTAALWYWPNQGVEALSWTLLLGWTMQCLTVFAACIYAGLSFRGWRQTIRREVASAMRLAAPILPGVAFSSATIAIISIFCSRLGVGAVAIYGYATKLHGAATQVIIISMGTVLLPHFAGLLAAKDHAQLKTLLERIGRVTMLTSVVLLGFILAMGKPLLMVLLGRGKFDPALARDVAWAWSLLTVSLFPFAVATYFAKVFQALRQPALLSLSSAIALATTAVGGALALIFQNFSLLILTPAFAQLCVLCFFVNRFRGRFGNDQFASDWLRALLICAAVCAPAIALDSYLRDHLNDVVQILALGIRAMVFCLVVAACAVLSKASTWLFRARPGPLSA